MSLFHAGNAPICGPIALFECVKPALHDYTIANMAANCHCRRQCRQLTYTYTISQAVFSDHAVGWAKELLVPNMTEHQIKRNFAAVEVVLKSYFNLRISQIYTQFIKPC